MGRKNSNESDSLWQWPSALAERIPQVWFVKSGPETITHDGENQVDLLDAHAQRLFAGEIRPANAGSAPGVVGDELAELTYLAEQVGLVVRPIPPAPLFRRELRQALLSAHRQQAAQRKLFAHPLFERGLVDRSLLERMEINSPLFWQIAAAVPVLIAVAALIWRFSRRPAEQPGDMAA